MKITTFLMFLLCLILFSLEESNGILMRCGLYTMIFFAQFMAYLRHTDKMKAERIQYSIQIVAAGYMLAGISKLRDSGLAWITDSPLGSIQIIKSYCNYYFDSGEIAQLQKGIELSGVVLKHALIVKILFGLSLMFELFAWISLRSKKYALIYGLLLLSMHIGIYYFMNILVIAIFYPMVAVMINPLSILYLSAEWIYRKVRLSV
jgi:hypothetical protein